MDLLRFSTAGSVDDGKSTLIGRMLYEARGVYEDQIAAVKKSPVNRSGREIDFSLLTDGLRAEREQGITIDVAYRYFATPKRKFIIADTPGHEQYTRNMVTGASTADLAIVLVDARKGLLVQSRRHAFLAALLGIPRLVVAINKMDLVEYSQTVFEQIRAEFIDFQGRIGARHAEFIPLSALDGDNIVTRSKNMPWFDGPPLLEYLETVPLTDGRDFESLRFPVQYVIRPDLHFRGFAGQLVSGILKPGMAVQALPSGKTSRVKQIATYDGDLNEAYPPMSVTVTLEDEIDVSRGDMLIDPTRPPQVSHRIEAVLTWMNESVLQLGKTYLLKHSTQLMQAAVTELAFRYDVNTLDEQQASTLRLNEIGTVTVETRKPLFFDPYTENRAMGCFILIDPVTNATLGAGMIRRALEERKANRVTDEEREGRYGHQSIRLALPGRPGLARVVERTLFDRGCAVAADDDAAPIGGLIVITTRADAADAFTPMGLPDDDEAAAERVIAILEDDGILRRL